MGRAGFNTWKLHLQNVFHFCYTFLLVYLGSVETTPRERNTNYTWPCFHRTFPTTSMHLAPGVGGEPVIVYPSFLSLSISSGRHHGWRLGATPGRKEMNHNLAHLPHPNHYHSKGQVLVSALTHQRPLFYVAWVTSIKAGGGMGDKK